MNSSSTQSDSLSDINDDHILKRKQDFNAKKNHICIVETDLKQAKNKDTRQHNQQYSSNSLTMKLKTSSLNSNLDVSSPVSAPNFQENLGVLSEIPAGAFLNQQQQLLTTRSRERIRKNE